ncbi:hypothetical protein [Noviherbaspirillum soli]|uniref:hypothetical protein n=1 Tax=Noviherbaspirillum soli TaxID=1064518 RepID=UPI001889CDD7|nr:hypothetical protein [Noviherbaspirillum soli]
MVKLHGSKPLQQSVFALEEDAITSLANANYANRAKRRQMDHQFVMPTSMRCKEVIRACRLMSR